MIELMAKVKIIGLLEELDSTLDLLQQVGTVEVDDIPAIEDSKHTRIHRIHLDETKEHLKSRYEELLLSISEILEILSGYTWPRSWWSSSDIKNAEQVAAPDSYYSGDHCLHCLNLIYTDRIEYVPIGKAETFVIVDLHEFILRSKGINHLVYHK